jgi:hypothetical protein
MQLYVNTKPDLPEGGPYANMNPGNGQPFGVIEFGEDAYVSVKTDDEARRIIAAAAILIEMRKMIGTPHEFEPSGAGSVVDFSHCARCGMLEDSDGHKPVITEPAPDDDDESGEDATVAIAESSQAERANPPHLAHPESMCRAMEDGYVCTAQAGHDGPDHIAHGRTEDDVVRRWPVAGRRTVIRLAEVAAQS